MTRLDYLERLNRLVEEGACAVQALPEGARLDELDEFEVAADLFGQEMAAIDCAIDDLVTVKPTGHRRWNSCDGGDDEHFITQDQSILD